MNIIRIRIRVKITIRCNTGGDLVWTFVIFKSSPLTGVGCKYERTAHGGQGGNK